MPKIQLRHDTSTNWTTYNPVLLEGECGVETDTNKFKFGDGTTAWNSLDYAGGGDLSNYYTKSQTDTLLEDYIPSSSVATPLEYSVTSHTVNCVNANNTVFWSKNTELGYDAVGGYYDNNDGGLPIITTSVGNGIIDNDYVITYNGNLSNKTISFTSTNSEDWFGSSLALVIGHTDDNGVFTPCFCIGNDNNSNNFLLELSGTISKTSDPWGYGITYWQASIRNASSSFYRNSYNPLAWKVTIDVVDTAGSLSFVIKTFLKDGTAGSTVNFTPSYFSEDISYLNTVVFPLYNYNASASNYSYNIADVGIFDSNNNQLWSVADTTTTKYLKLNIGTGLAVQSGNLVNTNPTPYSLPTATTSTLGGVKIDGTTITIDNNGVISSSGGGQTYTAGDGIDIANDEISVKVDGTTVDFNATGALTINLINGGNA